MAIDSEKKRRAAADVGRVVGGSTILPDGSIGQSDRSQLAGDFRFGDMEVGTDGSGNGRLMSFGLRIALS